MRKLWFMTAISLLLPLSAIAQDNPKAEVFGGYSYFRSNPRGYNLNGWEASVAGNVSNWFGVEGDFSGHYGAPTAFGIRIPGVNISSNSFMVGPKLSYREHGLTPFAHFLIGATRASTGAFGLSASNTAISAAVGGGLDIRLTDALAVRVIQADYLMTRFLEQRQNNFRMSFGLVLRLGHQ
jgi:opacity protein-like surface antigen